MNSNKQVVLTTAYLPPVDYFRIIISKGEWELEQWESYQKQSYRNRCTIYGANGPLPLVIPVQRAGNQSVPVREITIDNSKNWQTNHWRAIVSAYRSSPYFDFYEDDFAPFYINRYERLFDYNRELTLLLLQLIGASASVKLTEEWSSDYGDRDYRYSIHPKRESPLVTINENGRYHQVFAHKFGFVANLSVIDLLFNEGPEAYKFL